jgi:hypothetical protein
MNLRTYCATAKPSMLAERIVWKSMFVFIFDEARGLLNNWFQRSRRYAECLVKSSRK